MKHPNICSIFISHASAGADLIRAMLKSGIEVDFVEKCERSI